MRKWRRRFPKSHRAALLLDPGSNPKFAKIGSGPRRRRLLIDWYFFLRQSHRFKAIRNLITAMRAQETKHIRKLRAHTMQRMNASEFMGTE